LDRIINRQIERTLTVADKGKSVPHVTPFFISEIFLSFSTGRPRALMGPDLNVMIGGEAGDGVRQAGLLMDKMFVRGGLHVFSVFDYQSLIRGGHNYHLVRVSERPVRAPRRGVDVLIALNEDTVSRHSGELVEGSILLYDSDSVRPGDAAPARALPMPLTTMAREAGGPMIVRSSAALGALVHLVGYELEALLGVLKSQFKSKVYEVNERAARMGYEYARENFEPHGVRLRIRGDGGRLVMTGSEACALGAVAAGMKFYAAYPMTPASPILHYLARIQRDAGIGVIQAESEIAAINMIIGAAYAGVRSMTGTSGGGFSLMAEALGQAGGTETPIVVVIAQRPGPSTGLPTYTSQADLLFTVHASQGEFPRVVCAPGDIEETFYLTAEAFNLAERFQVPTIILLDKHITESFMDVEPFDTQAVSIDRGKHIRGEWTGPGEYRRYLITEDGISPRAIPGTRGAVVKQNSSEHNELGWASEDPENARRMQEKRLKKLRAISEALRGRSVEVWGDPSAEVVLLHWGSTRGAVLEATEALSEKGVRVRALRVVYLWPFPSEDVLDGLRGAKKIISVEQNATGQLAKLLRMETGVKVDHLVLRYDGRPFTPEDVVEGVRGVI